MRSVDRWKTVVAYGPLKEPAIYFESVVPVNFTFELIANERERLLSPHEAEEVWQYIRWITSELAPSDLAKCESYYTDLANANSLMMRSVARTLNKAIKDLESGTEKFSHRVPTAEFRKAVVRLLDQHNLNGAVTETTSLPALPTQCNDYDVMVSISSLGLIDASRASWDQIFEFRKDKVAQEKLRRFRLFAFSNYSGKSDAFIEDDIYTRIADYNAEIKKWGFDTRAGLVSAALCSKTMGAALTGSLISSLSGAFSPAIAAAVGGVALEIGKIAVTLSKKKHEMREFMRQNPFSFFEYADTKLACSKKDVTVSSQEAK